MPSDVSVVKAKAYRTVWPVQWHLFPVAQVSAAKVALVHDDISEASYERTFQTVVLKVELVYSTAKLIRQLWFHT